MDKRDRDLLRATVALLIVYWIADAVWTFDLNARLSRVEAAVEAGK